MAKGKMAMFEKYGSKVEKYSTKKGKMKHEKGEAKAELSMESKREKKLSKKKGK